MAIVLLAIGVFSAILIVNRYEFIVNTGENGIQYTIRADRITGNVCFLSGYYFLRSKTGLAGCDIPLIFTSPESLHVPKMPSNQP